MRPLISLILFSCLCQNPAALAVPGPDHVPLHRWYSAVRGDNFTTSDPRWRGSNGDTRSPDYRHSRLAGYILGPSTSPGDDLVPLHSWWSPSRKDNVLTSHPDWRGSPGETRSPDYQYVRLEGYAFAQPLAGTLPLYSWYSHSRGDNVTLTHWSWWSAGSDDAHRSPDYVRPSIEGWILPPNEFGEEALEPRFGVASQPLKRDLKVLLILEAFSDAPFAITRYNIARRFFGRDRVSVRRILSRASMGNIIIRSAGSVSITQPYSLGAVTPPNASVSEREDDANALRAADALFDFSELDANGDGRLGTDEAVIIKLLASDCACGQKRSAPALTLDGVDISGAGFTAICQNAHYHIFAEEIGHMLGFWDLYGFDARRNRRATFMADNCGTTISSGIGPFLLDPWHGMIAGWLRPRLIPISEAGGSAVVNAADFLTRVTPPRERPVLLYDPRHALDEYFVLQHRSPRGVSGLDAGVVNEGVAVWYTNVIKNDPRRLEKFDWPPPVASVNSRRGNTNAHFYLGADGSLGSGDFLRTGDSLELFWGGGGARSANVSVRVTSTSAKEAEIMWQHVRHGFRPRLDRAILEGGRFTLNGHFPPPRGIDLTVELRSGSRIQSIVLPERDRGGERMFSIAMPAAFASVASGATKMKMRVSLTAEPNAKGNWLELTRR